MKEIWLRVIGLESYYKVSNLGRVKRIKPFVFSGRYYPEQILEIRILASYPTVTLRTPTKCRKQCRVHILMLEAFVGSCPEGMECRHLNDICTDNEWPRNICWGTKKQNAFDRENNGRTAKAEKHGRSRLTTNNIKAMRSLNLNGWTNAKLSDKFGVSRSTISRIINGKTWNSI